MTVTNPFIHEYWVDLKKGLPIEREKKPLAQGDALADKFVVRVQEAGQDVDLSGVGVSAKVIRYDGQTVPLTGTVEDGAACVTLDASCYTVPGDIRVTIALAVGDMVQSVLVVLLNVETSQTSVIVDNGVIGDLSSLLGAIADMQAATAEARAELDSIQQEGAAFFAPVSMERTDFFRIDQSANLFDWTTAVDDYWIVASSNNRGQIVEQRYMCYAYVRHDGAGTYYAKVNAANYGINLSLIISLYNANYEYVTYVRAEADDPDAAASALYGAHFTLTEEHIAAGVVYIGYVTLKARKAEVMVVKGDGYPDAYIPYSRVCTIPELTVTPDNAKRLEANSLHGKVAVFDGDSIAEGSTAADGLSGWAGRIGAANEMEWHNYAVGGGTVVSVSGKHCIGTNIETIHTAYPELDYLILEGGTNDALRLREAGLGTYTAGDYSGSYDTATFTGALETLLYKAVSYYPHAKVGYIIVHRLEKDSGILRTYFDRIVEVCRKWGVPYIDLWRDSPLNLYIQSHYNSALDSQGNIDAGSLYADGMHLTAAGYDVITPKIEAWMRTL